MAAAAGAASAGATSRWTAVAVALAPEDDGVSLEQEMQKAYAAFAAAENGHGADVSPIVEAESLQTVATSAPIESAVPESALPIPAPVAPEDAQSLREVANAATEATSAAVKEFETVAAAYVAEGAPAPIASPSPEVSEAPASSAPETAPVVETQAEAQAEQPAVPVAEIAPEEPAPIEAKAEPTEPDIPPSVPDCLTTGEPENQSPAVDTPEIASREIPVGEESQQASEAAAAIPSEPAAKAEGDVVKKESDIVATTAAAWASWRRIRESDSSAVPPKEHSQDGKSDSHDAAAMAVAAGAENSPEQSASDSDPAIASIVDSVLADLRPKIVEEISRKLGKKK